MLSTCKKLFFIYIVCSRLYSYRGIRLKKFPVIGYLTVVINQGALTFFMVYHGADINLTTTIPWSGIVAAAFLIGGFYPITQVYQHKEDANDGVKTISILLGKKEPLYFAASCMQLHFHFLHFIFLINSR